MIEIPEFKFCVNDGLGQEFLPQQTDPEASGFDVKCAENRVEIKTFECAKISLGFRMFAPKGYWVELRPRSSSFVKKNLHCLYGVIDETYEHEMFFVCQYIPDSKNYILDNNFILNNERNSLDYYLGKTLVIEFGERIGQLIPKKRLDAKMTGISSEEFVKLCAERNSVRKGGFGSSGNF